MNQNNNPQWLKKYARWAGLGSQLVLTTLIGLAAGFWLDQKLETYPFFLIFGIFFGFGLSIYYSLKKFF